MPNLDKAAATSAIMGLGYAGDDTASVSIPSQSIGAGGTRDYTINLKQKRADSASLVQIKVSGHGYAVVNNKWINFDGNMFIRTAGPSYDMNFNSVHTAAGHEIRIRIANNSGAAQTIPSLTVTARSYYYTGPW